MPLKGADDSRRGSESEIAASKAGPSPPPIDYSQRPARRGSVNQSPVNIREGTIKEGNEKESPREEKKTSPNSEGKKPIPSWTPPATPSSSAQRPPRRVSKEMISKELFEAVSSGDAEEMKKLLKYVSPTALSILLM